MLRESQVNISRLLEPVAGDNPAGEDLRNDPSPTSLFQLLQSAQTKARREEKRAIMEGDTHFTQVPEWNDVFELASQALEKSKDLHIAVFLLESATRKFGVAGLRDGFTVISGLIDQYWDQLFPVADEDGGFERRTAFLRGLDGGERVGTLILPIQMMPLVEMSGKPELTIQFYDDSTASETVQAVIAAMSPAEAQELSVVANDCHEKVIAMRDVMQAKAGEFAPPTRNIEDAVQEVVRIAEAILSVVSPHAESTGVISTDSSGNENSPGGLVETSASISGPVRTRSQALSMLDAVAAFFKTHDPHSFVGYGASEVARWGRTPLPDLLAEMLQGNDAAMETLTKRLGVLIRESPPPEG